MKWEGHRQSDNVEDERGGSGPAIRAGGLGGGRGLGIGSVVIALVASAVFGVNPLTVLGLLSGQGAPSVQAPAAHVSQPANDSMTRFVRTTLADTEDVWGQVFKQAGSTYQQPKLVLFRGQTATACGAGQAAMGPFYCPADQKVYIDLSFYETLKNQLGAPGDFAQAYVIAHEVGHHVQNLMGVSGKVDAMRSRLSQVQYNAMSVRLELQADCLAGVWAHHANNQRQILENGDVQEAMNAAARIGDDALQKQSQGRVVPESFTHGTSAQRMRWFNAGLASGQVRQCDTFSQKSI